MPDPAVQWEMAWLAADRLKLAIDDKDTGAALEALAEVEGHLAWSWNYCPTCGRVVPDDP